MLLQGEYKIIEPVVDGCATAALQRAYAENATSSAQYTLAQL